MSKFMSIVAKEFREALPALIFFLLAFHMIGVTKAMLMGPITESHGS